ncbi:uncharacterized protein LOC143227395 [Tachypleus tridentatus]|uniref:uncharacterized protein LOC143227395 n=1 Tax=Tachypleus tridentatus TaxID=6853 RepID=UPI003FD33C1F
MSSVVRLIINMFIDRNFFTTFLHVVLTVTLASVTFDEINRLGPSCLNSCLTYNSGNSNNTSTSESCYCDNECAVYRDCCLDAKTVRQQPQDSPWHCISKDEYTGVFLRATCKPKWQGDQMIRKSCENTISDDQYDPIRHLPVTNPNTGVTYRNYYCAICNDDTSYDMVLWKLLLKCPFLNFYIIYRQNLTFEYVRDNLEYHDSKWGIWLDGDDDKLRFYDCSVKFQMPDDLTPNLRPCVRNLISECAWNWNISDVKEKCSYYTSVVYHEDKAYRNVHCALCNHVNLSELSCSKIESNIVMYRTFYPRAFPCCLTSMNTQERCWNIFVWSARMIVTTSSNITKNQMKSNRKNFRLYSRLALLMGLTWIIGLLAGYIDIEVLWYLFIFFNTLQGLFIFIAFSCIPKVRTSLQQRFISVFPKLSTFRSRTINSGTCSGLTSLTVVSSHQNSHQNIIQRELTHSNSTPAATSSHR